PLEGAAPGEATCILSGVEREEGKGPEWLVVRRQGGAGVVDLIGLDAASTGVSLHGLPGPGMFWHRLPGRRGVLAAPAELNSSSYYAPFRDTVTIDRDIAAETAMSGSASAGVLMGLLVFGAYWVIAGPLGYAVLKKTGYIRHAWVGFVAAAGVFTALAW